MARVPIPAGNSVELRPMTDEKFRAADNNGGVLGGLGQGFRQLGEAGSQYAEVQDHIDRQLDDAGTKTLDNSGVLAAQTIRSNFMSQQGLNAGVALPGAKQALQKLRDDTIAKATTPRMRAMLTQVLDRRIASWTGEFQEHYVGQLNHAENLASTARTQLAGQEAAATTDPTARLENIATGKGEIAKLNAKLGLGPDVTTADQFKFESDVHTAVATKMIAGDDISGAQAYLQANKDRISASDETRLQGMLKGPLERREANAYVDAKMGAATRNGGASFTYADPLHGAGRAPVVGGQYGAGRDYGSHHGVDLPAPNGTAIYPTAPGTAHVSHSEKGGTIVTVDHGDGLVSKYMHMGAVKIKDGDTVTPDSVIGSVGMTGRSTGPHLHWEVRKNGQPVDPTHLAGQAQQSPQRHDLNGLLGSVDADLQAGKITPEQADRFKTEIQQRVSMDDRLLSRQQSDAYDEAIKRTISLGDNFTSTSQLGGAYARMSPEQQYTLSERARSNAKDQQERNAASQAFNIAMNTPGFAWNPFDTGQKKVIDQVVASKGGTPQAAFDVWQRTGILAKPGAVALRGGLISTDPASVQATANIAGNMLRRKPNAFAGIDGGEDIERSALAFNHYTFDLGMSPQQAAQRIAQENTPEFKAKNKIGQPEIDAYRKQVRRFGANLSSAFDGAGFNSPDRQNEAAQSFVDLAVEQMQHGADANTAQAIASRQLHKVYAVSRNGKVRKYAPEAIYPAVGGSHNYVYEDAAKTVEAETGHKVTPSQVQLVAIPSVTDEDFRNNRPARYRILYARNENGQVIQDIVPGEFAADISGASKAATERRRVQMKQAVRDKQMLEDMQFVPMHSDPGPAD